MKTVYKKEYFTITETEISGQKTCIYTIVNNKFETIGKIKWQGSFRKYAFFPEMNTVWDSECLADVIEVLDDINKNYRSKKLGNVNE